MKFQAPRKTYPTSLIDNFLYFLILILILEDPSLLECIKNVAYDQFYCEHLYVFSAIALKKILNKYNLEIFDIENVNTHGGSNRYYIKNKKNKFFKINSKVQKNINLEKKFGLHKFNTYKKFECLIKSVLKFFSED